MRGNLLISYFISFLLLGILGACRDENPEEKGRDRGPGKILLESEVDQLYLNRVNDNGFADGDIMGVYIVDYVGGEPGECRITATVPPTYNILIMRRKINGLLPWISTGKTARLR